MRIIKIITIFNEEIIVSCYNYENVKKGVDHNFYTNLGSIPEVEVKEVAIIN